MTVFEQRIFDGLRAVDEQAAIEPFCSWATQWPRLFLPIKTMADAELHDGGSTSFTLVFLLKASSARSRAAARNIFAAGYEFECGKTAIS